MVNLFDYLKWRADSSLSVKPFNEVDNLLLAGLSYTVFDGILSDSGEFKPLAEVADAFFSAHSREDIQKETGFLYRAPLLMDGMLSGERFHDLKLGYYINEVDSDVNAQISAVTFLTDDGCAYIAFRGTDSTLAGWREEPPEGEVEKALRKPFVPSFRPGVGSVPPKIPERTLWPGPDGTPASLDPAGRAEWIAAARAFWDGCPALTVHRAKRNAAKGDRA